MRPEARAGAGGGWRHALCVLLAAFSACFSGVARTDALDGTLEVGRPNPGSPAWRSTPAPFVLARDGRPVALTQPHGEWIEFL
mgnify:CR=1 FL=1